MDVVRGQTSSLHRSNNRHDACPPTVKFGIAEGRAIKVSNGTMQNRGNTLCPYCEQVTPVADLRTAGQAGRMGERMVAVITEDKGGKRYRPVEDSDLRAFRMASDIPAERPQELILAEVSGSDEHVSHRGQFTTYMYGMKTWGSLFNPRQLVAMQTFVACLHGALDAMKQEIDDDEYRKAIGIYLGLWVSRNAMRMTSTGRWDPGGETFQTPFDAQAIPMKWDYPEANPFSSVTGGFNNQIYWVSHYLEHEAGNSLSGRVYRGDGAQLSVQSQSADVVITDPPYFDAIAYADLSDFFYVWLKRGIGELMPEMVLTPLTPKTDEATALKHRHKGDANESGRSLQNEAGGRARGSTPRPKTRRPYVRHVCPSVHKGVGCARGRVV